MNINLSLFLASLGLAASAQFRGSSNGGNRGSAHSSASTGDSPDTSTGTSEGDIHDEQRVGRKTEIWKASPGGVDHEKLYGFEMMEVEPVTDPIPSDHTVATSNKAAPHGAGNNNGIGMQTIEVSATETRVQDTPCTLFLRASMNVDAMLTGLEEVVCEFRDEAAGTTIDKLIGPGIQELLLGDFESDILRSGEAALVSPGIRRDSTNELDLSGVDPKLIRIEKTGNGQDEGRRLSSSTGTKKLLAVKVNTGGGAKSPPMTLDELYDAYFGDAVNLDSQIQACSFGKLSIEPYKSTTSTGVTISNGVYEITVGATYQGSDSAIESEARTVLGNELGSLTSQFDFVALNVPAEGQQYAAYAYINSWLSLYQGQYYGYVTVLMHEIGHNLGLGHSGEGGSTYGDISGVMGAMYDDDRNVCFNGPKNGQLGWYSDRMIDITDTDYDGLLYGIASYGSLNSDEKVLLKMQYSSNDYYVSYNKAIGINSQTGEGGNKVLVHRRSIGNGYAASTLLAKLNVGQSYNVGSTPVYFKSTDGDAAEVIVGSPSTPTVSPEPTTVLGCNDVTGWTDAYGDNCVWYETYDEEGCPNYGNNFANPTTGVTPNEACCYCGGGVASTAQPTSPDSTTDVPSLRPTISTSPSSSPSNSPTVSASPSSSPSDSPTVSTSPSSSPSTSPTTSTSPSSSPSNSPTISTSPSSSPSNSPSISTSPSSSPSNSPTISTSPSSSPSTSPTISLSPSSSPSNSPTISTSPSSSPSTFPTISTSPSFSPSNSPTISASPSSSPSTSPTISTSPSSSPSDSPTVSDADNDGVIYALDKCPSTPETAFRGTDNRTIVDEEGCALEEHCLCDDDWKNHGQYVNCNADVSKDFEREGHMTNVERGQFMESVAANNCGKQ